MPPAKEATKQTPIDLTLPRHDRNKLSSGPSNPVITLPPPPKRSAGLISPATPAKRPVGRPRKVVALPTEAEQFPKPKRPGRPRKIGAARHVPAPRKSQAQKSTEYFEARVVVNPMAMESVLQEGHRVIHGVKRENYGPVEESFELIWKGWEPIMASNLPGPVKVSLCMDWLKTVRFLTARDRDSLTDKAGYTGLCAILLGID